MDAFDHKPTPEENAKAMLAKRCEIAALLDEARATGNQKEIRSWEAALRKWDKLISQYDLERYA